ncbi:DUF7344 domain-containing protein [Halostagnicola kamekurae]|uniref:DUF7344 domain-containing protein n=1 Tax=Halostagnicola kamekurae TaxID=619731 RepID=A0A1I6RFV7_9EURY|nr:hypothetical protein [Halostagnicola kamekurae]SFS63597.1 hypothetical protein SAMN04488556_1766 [Halostagnicola kamekurae]
MTAAARPDQPAKFPRKLTTDKALHLFQPIRRRLVVELVDVLGPMHIRALSDAIACITDSQYDSVYVSLSQQHLPKLDDYDIVEFDEQDLEVAPGPHFADCAAFVDDAQSRFRSEADSEQIDRGER